MIIFTWFFYFPVILFFFLSHLIRLFLHFHMWPLHKIYLFSCMIIYLFVCWFLFPCRKCKLWFITENLHVISSVYGLYLQKKKKKHVHVWSLITHVIIIIINNGNNYYYYFYKGLRNQLDALVRKSLWCCTLITEKKS